MGYRHRSRASDESVRFKNWPESDKVQPLAFAAYKVGMTHIVGVQNRPKATAQGMDIAVPVTVLAAPPMKVFAVRAYIMDGNDERALTEVIADKVDSNLHRRITSFRKGKAPDFSKIETNLNSIIDIRLLASTNRDATSIAKKPHVFEIAIGGKTVKEKLDYAKTVLGKEITVNDVFSEKEFVDVKGVTKGKGWQGPVKRWGVKMQPHKSKKHRNTGTIGSKNPDETLWTVPMPGQMGYHTRTEVNKKIMKIGADGAEVTVKGGFLHYGTLDKVPFIVLAGTVQGPTKRVLALRKSIRFNGKDKYQLGEIKHFSTSSKQGK